MFWSKVGQNKRGSLETVTIRFCITRLNSSVHSLGWRYRVKQYPSDSLLCHNDKNEAILTLLHNHVCITRKQYYFTLLLLSVRQTELFFAVHLSLSHGSRELRCPLRSGETEAQVLTTATWEINVRGINRISAFWLSHSALWATRQKWKSGLQCDSAALPSSAIGKLGNYK